MVDYTDKKNIFNHSTTFKRPMYNTLKILLRKINHLHLKYNQK